MIRPPVSRQCICSPAGSTTGSVFAVRDHAINLRRASASDEFATCEALANTAAARGAGEIGTGVQQPWWWIMIVGADSIGCNGTEQEKKISRTAGNFNFFKTFQMVGCCGHYVYDKLSSSRMSSSKVPLENIDSPVHQCTQDVAPNETAKI